MRSSTDSNITNNMIFTIYFMLIRLKKEAMAIVISTAKITINVENALKASDELLLSIVINTMYV